jgi:hypothetical protein
MTEFIDEYIDELADDDCAMDVWAVGPADTLFDSPVNLNDYAVEHKLDLLKADGLDAACIGIMQGEENKILVYSVSLVIGILMERDGMDWEEAVEFFDFNIAGAYMGPMTPFWADAVDLGTVH